MNRCEPKRLTLRYAGVIFKFALIQSKVLIYADTKKKTAGANSKTSQFAQSLRQAKILILEILYVFLQLKFSPSLILNKLKRFETGSRCKRKSIAQIQELK